MSGTSSSPDVARSAGRLRRLLRLGPPRADAPLRPGDLQFLTPLQGAQVLEPAPAAAWAVYLMLALLVAAVCWAAVAKVDIVVRANGRIVPDGKEQVIASLEGGILGELLVREGQHVRVGQELARLDPTRFEAQQAEGQARHVALKGALARLQAESTGLPLAFPPEVRAVPPVVEGETEVYQTRQRALSEAVAITRRSIALLEKELAMSQSMAAQGLLSEVEVMRIRRQVNELDLQAQERLNRFRQDASADLVRVRTELAQLDEQQVVRVDALRRTTLTSPVDGIVKTIRVNTVGGVVAPSVPLMEIVPLGARTLVEARVMPADIGFVEVGQPATIRLSAYDYAVYGALEGTVEAISPDALSEGQPAGEGSYYRALVRARADGLQALGKPLPVLPGMTGTADIRTGERSVLAFVLRPLLKATDAFRER